MIGYILSLSILVAAVILIRAVFCKTVSPRAIYALWLVVVIRMLLPISLFEIDLTLPELPQTGQTEQSMPSERTPENTDADAAEEQTAHATPAMQGAAETGLTGQIAPTDPSYEIKSKSAPINPYRIADFIWLCGATITAAWMLYTGVTYTRRLKKGRRLYKTIRGTNVYVSDNAGVSCIAGLFPSVYITPESANGDSEMMIILHEYTHIRHGDHVWSLFRALALVVFWWNPLVWAAATLSKRDAEFACDDAVASKLDDTGRLKYANILLDTIPQKSKYAVGLGSAPIKKRIMMLTSKRKNSLICLILAFVLVFGAAGCSFISFNEKRGQEGSVDLSTDENPQTEDSVEIPPDTVLPDNFEEFYHNAEKVYAAFTGHRRDLIKSNPVQNRFMIDSVDYYIVNVDGYTTLSGLRNYCEQYFVPDFTDELMSVTKQLYVPELANEPIPSDRYRDYPIFTESNGQLYYINLYNSSFNYYNYDVGKDYEMTLEGVENGVYKVRIGASFDYLNNKYKHYSIPVTGYCTYTKTADGGIRFTSFELMAAKLQEAYDSFFDPDAFGGFLPGGITQRLFWHRITDTDDYLYFCAVRTLNSMGTAYTDDPPKDFRIFHVNGNDKQFIYSLEAVREKLEEELEYDTVCPVVAMDGPVSKSCRFIIQLTKGSRTFYVMFDNFDNLEEDHLAFTYRGIISDLDIGEWKLIFRDSFNKAKTYFDWN